MTFNSNNPSLALLCLSFLLWLSPTAAHAGPEADREFTFAARLMQTGETDLAIEAFNEFIRNHGDDARLGDARYYLALLARQKGNLAEAQRQLAAVQNAHQVTAEGLNLLRGQIAIEAGDAKAAVGHLEKIDPNKLPDAESKAGWAYMLGVAYRSTGNLQGAEQKFDAATEADSSVRGPALVELGKVRVDLKQPAAALDALMDATEHPLDPALAAEARRLAADIAYSQKQYARAADLYREVIQRHQTSSEFGPALVGVLRSLYASGQMKPLIEEHRTIAKVLPASAEPEALYLLGAAHVSEKQYAQGADAFKQFYERFGNQHPLYPEVAYLYAVCYFHTDLDGFEKWFAKIEDKLDKMPHGNELRYLRAQGAAKRDQPAAAVQYLTPLVQDPKNPFAKDALMQRAALNEQAGNAAAAAADYALFIERYGEDAASNDAGRRAIDLAFNAGAYERVVELAVPWLGREGIPADVAAAVRLKLALAYIKLGQRDRAAATLDALIAAKPSEEIAALTRFYRGLLLAAQAKGPGAGNGQNDTTKPAIDALEAAMTGPLPPAQQAEALDLIARLHRIGGRDQPALAVYAKLRERRSVDRFDVATALWVGRGQYDAGEPREALPWLRSVAGREDAPDNARAEALFLTGQSLAALNDHDAAIDTFRRLVAFSHGYGDQGRLGLARSLRATGNDEEALNEYNGLLVVEGTDVQAAAWSESAQMMLAQAARLRQAGDIADADRVKTEAVKRLNRVAIQFDLKQLEPMPTLALLELGVIAADEKDADKARQRFEAVVFRHKDGPWREAGQAELNLLEGKRGDAVFLLRKMAKQSADPAAADYAAGRLKTLGEQP